MLLKPHYLYKYKSVNTCEDVLRIKDVLEKKRLYFPTAAQLNDPFEGCCIEIHFSYAGSGYRAALGGIDGFYYSELMKYRILSFTSIANSPIMWAHYGNEYKGCCLIISSNNTLKTVKPVIYTDSVFSADDIENSSDKLPKIAEEALLIKKRDWSYENEWRFMKQCDDKYINLYNDELVGIILGNNIDRVFADEIYSICCKEKICCIKTRIMKSNYAVKFVPYNSSDDMIFRFAVDSADNYDLKQLLSVLNGEMSPNGFYNSR